MKALRVLVAGVALALALFAGGGSHHAYADVGVCMSCAESSMVLEG